MAVKPPEEVVPGGTTAEELMRWLRELAQEKVGDRPHAFALAATSDGAQHVIVVTTEGYEVLTYEMDVPGLGRVELAVEPPDHAEAMALLAELNGEPGRLPEEAARAAIAREGFPEGADAVHRRRLH